MNKYFVRMLKNETFEVVHRVDNLPVYDDDTNGNDKPLNFKNGDIADEYCGILNRECEHQYQEDSTVCTKCGE